MNVPSTERVPQFDPTLGLICAQTWWDLGKLLAHVDNDAWISKRIPAWTLDQDEMYGKYLTVGAVRAFANRVFEILSRKFQGQSISTEARAIMDETTRGIYRDNGPYLEYEETSDVYWAIELKLVLDELERPSDGKGLGWLNAVDQCRECDKFFVKQRRDQIFDTAKCRTKFSNRDSYLRRRIGGRRH